MQTFVPYPDLAESARVLDMKRLGKQRVEVLQILNAMDPTPRMHRTVGWANHPATKMWAANRSGLIAYGVAICDEWIARGYRDTCRDKILCLGRPDASHMPFWWGDEAIHASHRSNLLRKMGDHYRQFGWTEPNDLPYVWPVE